VRSAKGQYGMNSLNSPGDFVENWLRKKRDKFPNSRTVVAVSDATQSGQLDEAKLLKRLRELSKSTKKEERDDQG
jgi:hypothetical protein